MLDVVDAPAGPEVNAQLADSFPYRGDVAGKAMRKALEPREHSAADGAVLEVCQPVGEGR
jgi:hypothetical protein